MGFIKRMIMVMEERDGNREDDSVYGVITKSLDHGPY